MPSEARSERRLHPLSWIFTGGTIIRGMIFPAILFLFASGGAGRYEILALIFVLPAFVISVVRYRLYRYRFDPDEMVIKDGLLTRNERHIPYSRIQNIDLAQNPLHRLLNVATVRLETASGGKPEALIRVLSTAAIEEMRGLVFAERDESPSDQPLDEPEGPLLELPTRELVKLGLISNRGMAIVAAAMGVFWQLDLFDLDWEQYAEGLPSWVPRSLPANPVLTGVLVGASILFVGLLLLRSLSVAWTIFKLHRFRLGRRGDDLRAEYGFFTRVTATIPTPRIQLVSVHESWLHRRFGRVSVRVKTAGGGSAGEDAPSSERQWLAPLIPREEVSRLVAQVLPEIDLDSIEWRPIEARARRRIFARSAALAVVPTTVAVIFLNFWGLLIPAIVFPWAWLHATLYVKHAGWAVTPWGVIHRKGWWSRNTYLVRFSKVQSVEWSQTPFDRRHRMARLRVDTAGAGMLGQSVEIAYLSVATATEVSTRLYAEAAETSFRW